MKHFVTLIGFAVLAIATDVDRILNEANDQFTASMFMEVSKLNPEQSVVLSAYSVLPPLGQLAIASVGDSHDEILRAIHFPDDNATMDALSLANNNLQSIKGVELKLANRIYINKGAELNPNFVTISRDIFKSEAKNIDFEKNTEAASEINGWVEQTTNHRIKNLVDPKSLGAGTQAILVSAIYFKGNWKDKFKKEDTKPRDFYVTKDVTIKLPTMNRKSYYKYFESPKLNAKLLEIPYEGEETSFLAVVPNDIEGLRALKEQLKDPSTLAEAVSNMQKIEVDVYLPKFRMESTTDLKKVLQNIHINKLFDVQEAKLHRLLKNESNISISDAIQKAFIEINEGGTEAAASNLFIAVGATGPRYPKPIFEANRPFYFEIRYKSTKLFNGVKY